MPSTKIVALKKQDERNVMRLVPRLIPDPDQVGWCHVQEMFPGATVDKMVLFGPNMNFCYKPRVNFNVRELIGHLVCASVNPLSLAVICDDTIPADKLDTVAITVNDVLFKALIIAPDMLFFALTQVV